MLTDEEKLKDRFPTIHPMPNGGYRFTLYITNPKTGVRKQYAFQNKKWTMDEAVHSYDLIKGMGYKYIDMMSVYKHDDFLSRKVKTLSNTFEAFMKHLQVKEKCKTSYLEVYRINFKAHILPYFGDVRFDSIMQSDVNGWLTYLQDKTNAHDPTKKLSIRTRNAIVTNFRSLYKFAVETKAYRDELKIERLGKGNGSVATRSYWDHRYWPTFLSVIPQDDLDGIVMMRIFLSIGLRLSECRALTFDKFNFLDNTVVINTNLVRSLGPSGKMVWVKAATKGFETATLPLDVKTMWFAKQLMNKAVAENPGVPLSQLYLIGGKTFKSPNYFRRKFNRYKAEAIKLEPMMDPDCDIHSLRHSVATYVATHVGVVQCKTLLRHKSLAVSSMYVHHELDESLAIKISRNFG